jgi:hypothetical protein
MCRIPYAVLVLAVSACNTYPTGPYQQADANRKLCDSAGEIAAMAYPARCDS